MKINRRQLRGRSRRFNSRSRFHIEMLESRRMLAGDGPPNVLSINRLDADPTSSSLINYSVLFDESVTGVDSADFRITRTGAITGPSISSVSGSGSTYTVQINSGTGSGTLRLDLQDNDSIRDSSNARLGGNGSNNGNFNGQVYTIDKTFPTAVSLTRLDPSPTSSSSVRYSVQFSESVVGVDTTDFQLVASGVVGASIQQVTGSGSNYTITVQSGTSDGTLSVNLIDNDSIVDTAGNRLGGTGINNGALSGPSYTLDRAPEIVSINRTTAELTNSPTVSFAVAFSENVFNVDVSDFAASATGLTGTSVVSVSGSGSTWFVTVNSGTGVGTLGLSVLGNAITDTIGNLLIVPAPASQSYSVDRVAPTVVSISRDHATITNLSAVAFTVQFSEPVSGVALDDFALEHL